MLFTQILIFPYSYRYLISLIYIIIWWLSLCWIGGIIAKLAQFILSGGESSASSSPSLKNSGQYFCRRINGWQSFCECNEGHIFFSWSTNRTNEQNFIDFSRRLDVFKAKFSLKIYLVPEKSTFLRFWALGCSIIEQISSTLLKNGSDIIFVAGFAKKFFQLF